MSLAEELLNSVSEDGSTLGNVLVWDGDTTNSERLAGTNLWRISTQAIPVDSIIGSKLKWSNGGTHTVVLEDVEDLRSVDLEVDGNGDATIQGEPMYKISCSLSGTEEVHMVIVTESYIADTLIKRGVYLLKNSSGWVESVTVESGTFGTGSDSSNAAIEPHIVIGADRFITVPQELKRLAVQHDHNIETVTFDCPRYWDNHDMSKMKVYINGVRADKEPFIYPVDTGVTVDTVDDTIMHFDWTISREVTEEKGNIIFLVCVKSVDGDGNEKEHWNSELCKDCYISEGLEILETVINQYPDVVTHLLTRMSTVEEKTTLASMLKYLDTYFKTDSNINEVLKNYVTEWMSEDTEAQAYIADVIDTYVKDVLKPTDATLSIEGGVADAAATGDAIENMINVTNDTAITDSTAGILKINKLYGRSEQLRPTGAQLVEKAYVEPTNTNQYATVLWIKADLKPATTYTISFEGTAGNWLYINENITPYAHFKVVDGVTLLTFTTLTTLDTTDGKYSADKGWIIFKNDTAQSSPNVFDNLMLNEGVEALPWEPYTGGIAAPNPEYPQEIKSAGDGGVIEGKVTGKNLLSNTATSQTINGVTFTVNEDGSVKVKGTCTSDYGLRLNRGVLFPDGDYVLSKRTVVYLYDDNWDGSTVVYHNNSSAYFSIGERKNVEVIIWVSTGTTYDETVYPMIRLASIEDDTYEPYAEKALSIQTPNGLPGIPVTDASLANYTDPDGQMWCCDEIDFEREVYVQRIGTILPTEWELHNVYSSSSGYRFKAKINGIVTGITKPIRYVPCVCSHYLFKKITSYSSSGDYITTDEAHEKGSIYIRTTNEELSTTAKFTEWATANNMITYYILATPIERPLTRDQLLAIRNFSSGEGGTNVMLENVAPGVELEYSRTLAASYILENQKDLAAHNDPYRDVVVEDEELFTLDDCVAGGLKVVETFGKSVQETTSGKNLLKNTATSQTIDGVTFTVNADGSVTLNGTATAEINFDMWSSLPSGIAAYANLIQISGNYTGTISHNEFDGNWLGGSAGLGINIPRELYVDIDYKCFRINMVSGTKCDNLKVGFIVATEGYDTYEPYTGGIPSPNPEYPQPIVSAGQKLAEGNQLLNIDGQLLPTSAKSIETNSAVYSAVIETNSHTTISIDGDSALINSGVVRCGLSNTYPANGGAIDSYVEFGMPYKLDVSGYKYVVIAFSVHGTNATKEQLENSIMVNYGNEYLPWELYTGGVKAAFDVGISKKLTGGQLIESYTERTYTEQYYDVLRIHADLKPNTTYTISFKGKAGNKLYINEYIAKDTVFTVENGRTTYTFTIYATLDSTKTLQCDATEGWILFKNAIAQSGANVFEELMLNEGLTALPYEPYTEQTLTLNRVLRGIPVTDESLANYTDENGQMWCADEINVERGVLVQRVGETVYDGSSDESWNVTSANTSGKVRLHTAYGISNICITKLDANLNSDIMCSQYNASSPNHTYLGYKGISVDSNKRICLYDENFQDADSFTAHLAENPMVFSYILATPIETPLTDEEILTLHKLKTNADITHIYGSNDPAPAVRLRYGVTDVAGLTLENSNLVETNEVLIRELNEALPYKVVIDDTAGTIDFIDR